MITFLLCHVIIEIVLLFAVDGRDSKLDVEPHRFCYDRNCDYKFVIYST